MAEHKKKILVIDDSQSSRYLYKAVLSNTGDFVTFLCPNLAEGLKIFKEINPDLIVLDMDLPDGSGMDFLKEIRSQGSQSKVIVISAIKASDVIIQSAKLGIGTYLIKPVDINLFVKKVKEFLELAVP
ncbi:MAG: response regulator [Candidatus Aureabacteria bacterium]|nr:response regulator [Candidatus Auribacterota bacterium]